MNIEKGFHSLIKKKSIQELSLEPTALRASAEYFPGGEGRVQRKKDQKLAKNTENCTICLFKGGGNGKNIKK